MASGCAQRHPDATKSHFRRFVNPLWHREQAVIRLRRLQVEANHLQVGSEPGIHLSLDGYTASFSTRMAHIFLPDRVASFLLHDLTYEDIIYLLISIMCEWRPSLPDITFNLAGKNFTLILCEYTILHAFLFLSGFLQCFDEYFVVAPL